MARYPPVRSDWYSIELAEDERLEIQYDANTLGSPVDLVVSLYGPDTDLLPPAVKVRNTVYREFL